MISREQLKKDVVDQLYWDDRVDAAQVQVEAGDDGRVRLSGVVPNYNAYRAAEVDARSVRGVKTVQNELQVRSPGEAIIDDREIASGVVGALTWYPEIDASRIEVGVESGNVTLAGIVDAYWKKLKAEELALDTAGVVWVTNELAVVPSKSLEDEAIAKNVVTALERNSDILDPDWIEVSVENGVVSLSGTVPDWHAMKAAEDAASFTPWVLEVISRLSVEQSG